MGVVSVALLLTGLLYYFSFSQRAQRLIEKQAKEINKQIVLNYERYIESIIETANYIQIASVPLDWSLDQERLQDIYALNSQLKEDVVSIFLFDEMGHRLLGDRISRSRELAVSGEAWFTGALRDSSIFHFVADGAQSVSADRDEEVISVSKSVMYGQAGEELRGVLLIELNFQVIRNLAQKTDLGPGGHILILDGDDEAVYTSQDPNENQQESLQRALDTVLGGLETTLGTHQMYLNINTLSHTRWRIATYLNTDEIETVRKSMLPLALVIFGVSMIGTTILAAFISFRISEPLHQLQRIMGKIEAGAINTEVSVSGQKEVVMLGRSFNSMLLKIRELMDRVVAEQREKRKTELRALQNQINPHFLYNSLDSIVWLAEHNRSEDVITTVIALARFFRISISRGANFIKVRDEIEHVRNYLTIQSVRYVDKFTYSFDIDEELMDRKVMKLILQPLVENAIHHGIGDEEGSISVQGSLDGGFMVFQVTNTGYGLTEKRIAEIHKSLNTPGAWGTGVGLKNVNQRLQIYYGEMAGVRIGSLPDERTTVTIRIPTGEEEENE